MLVLALVLFSDGFSCSVLLELWALKALKFKSCCSGSLVSVSDFKSMLKQSFLPTLQTQNRTMQRPRASSLPPTARILRRADQPVKAGRLPGGELANWQFSHHFESFGGSEGGLDFPEGWTVAKAASASAEDEVTRTKPEG